MQQISARLLFIQQTVSINQILSQMSVLVILFRLFCHVFGRFLRKKTLAFLPPSQFANFCKQMSSSHQYMQQSPGAGSSSSSTRMGEIEHLPQLSDNLSSLCMSPEYSDVVLVAEGQKLYAHKVSWFGKNLLFILLILRFSCFLKGQ